jgi:hypothetical protein
VISWKICLQLLFIRPDTVGEGWHALVTSRVDPLVVVMVILGCWLTPVVVEFTWLSSPTRRFALLLFWRI